MKKIAEKQYSGKASGGRIMKCRKCGEPSSGEICKTCELWRSA